MCLSPDCTRKVSTAGYCTKHTFEKLGRPLPAHLQKGHVRVPKAVKAYKKAVERERELFKAKAEGEAGEELAPPPCEFHTDPSSCTQYGCKRRSKHVR